eukprot:GHVR01131322.1.p1 GENE.GHVR01131322.1~~GHVR01131322.1.p1  ORF type:complete len:132 (+),score=22.46 GHVR01131322.1:49-444(+)
MGFIDKIKKTFSGDDDFDPDQLEESYVEISESSSEPKSKIVIRPFVLEDFADIKHILDSLREGYTIPLINIKPLKDKDLVELKRAINKLKKTTDAINGDIAGFGDDWIAVTPNFAMIHRDHKEDSTEMDRL